MRRARAEKRLGVMLGTMPYIHQSTAVVDVGNAVWLISWLEIAPAIS
jgi:hypothetical protein